MEREPIGRALRHPLHPLLVHFPLALWGMSFVFDVLSLRVGPAMVEAARFNLIGGVAAAVIAGASGVLDYRTRLPRKSPVRRIGRYHAGLNAVATGLFAVSLALRWRAPMATVTPPLPFLLSALGVVVIGLSAYLGGVMVYNHAIGVDLTRAHKVIEPRAAERQKLLEER